MKTNKIALFLAMGLPLLSIAQSEQPFTLSGTVNNIQGQPAKVLLYYPSKGQNFMDSTEIKNGKYNFSGLASGPIRADLYLKFKDAGKKLNMQTDIASIFIEPGNIQITSNGNFSNATVTGSPANDEFRKIQAQAKPYEAQISPLIQQFETYGKANDKAGQDRVQAQIRSIQNQMNEEVYGGYVKNNPGSPIALFALQQYAGIMVKNPEAVESLLALLPADQQQSQDGQKLAQLIRFSKITEPGKIAPDFIQNDVNGNPVALSSFRGNYVLIDFWASWCGPCRAENTGLVATYKKYRPQGFQILGVSLDQPGAKAKWIDAIQKDSLTWTQVSDLQFWNNAVAKKYGVVAIPQNFLIDPNGKIVARGLRGQELSDKLASLYK